MKKTTKALLGLLVLAPALAMAQIKIAVVEPVRAIAESEEGKSHISDLQTTERNANEQLAKLREDGQRIMRRLDAERQTLSRAQAQKLEDELQMKNFEFENAGKRAQQSIQEKQAEFRSKMDGKLQKAVAEVAKAKEYDLVLIKETVLYSSETYDITSDVIKAINRIK